MHDISNTDFITFKFTSLTASESSEFIANSKSSFYNILGYVPVLWHYIVFGLDCSIKPSKPESEIKGKNQIQLNSHVLFLLFDIALLVVNTFWYSSISC
jgi:hypothetical protein